MLLPVIKIWCYVADWINNNPLNKRDECRVEIIKCINIKNTKRSKEKLSYNNYWSGVKHAKERKMSELNQIYSKRGKCPEKLL